MGIAIPDEDLQRLNALKNVLAAIVNGVAAVIFIVVADVAWAAGAAARGRLRGRRAARREGRPAALPGAAARPDRRRRRRGDRPAADLSPGAHARMARCGSSPSRSSLLLAGAAPAAAELRSGEGTTAPAYPGNALELTRAGPFVAQTVQRVRFGGHAEWKAPTDAQTIPYELYLYVQDAAKSDTCADGYGAQLQKAINLPGLNGVDRQLGVRDGGRHRDRAGRPRDRAGLVGAVAAVLGPARRARGAAVRVPALDPRRGRGLRAGRRGRPAGVPRRHAVGAGAATGSRSTATSAARCRCGSRAAGASRTVRTRLSTRSGDGAVRTGSLPRGRYTVRFVAGAVRLAGATRVRVR